VFINSAHKKVPPSDPFRWWNFQDGFCVSACCFNVIFFKWRLWLFQLLL